MGLNFKNPRFGNTFELNGPIVKSTVHGTTILNTNRNQYEAFSVTFDSLSEDDKNSFMNFMTSSVGQELTLTDHEGFEWIGFIKDNEAIATAQGPGCNYACGFTFEGERL